MEYLIKWNAGLGDKFKVVKAIDEEEAEREAYDSWREEAENEAEYEVIGIATDELLQEYDVN